VLKISPLQSDEKLWCTWNIYILVPWNTCTKHIRPSR